MTTWSIVLIIIIVLILLSILGYFLFKRLSSSWSNVSKMMKLYQAANNQKKQSGFQKPQYTKRSKNHKKKSRRK